jgi:hypothetical protein
MSLVVGTYCYQLPIKFLKVTFACKHLCRNTLLRLCLLVPGVVRESLVVSNWVCLDFGVLRGASWFVAWLLQKEDSSGQLAPL